MDNDTAITNLSEFLTKHPEYHVIIEASERHAYGLQIALIRTEFDSDGNRKNAVWHGCTGDAEFAAEEAILSIADFLANLEWKPIKWDSNTLYELRNTKSPVYHSHVATRLADKQIGQNYTIAIRAYLMPKPRNGWSVFKRQGRRIIGYGN